MNIITVDAAAAALGCTAKTIRYQLARAEAAGQSFARKHAGIWLLYESDLPALREWIDQARRASGFQPGNALWRRGKPGRKKKIPADSANGKSSSRKDLRKSAKAGRKK